MSKKIYVTEEQYRKLMKSKNPGRTILISESQLQSLKEFEDSKVLYYDFESKVRDYMNELKDNPCNPKYDEFFTSHDIPQDVLQNKMIDLGIIKRSDKIDEPEDANGKKHSVHSRKFIFSGADFNYKIDKLYNTFFKDGEKRLNETDCSGVGGDAGGFSVDTNAPGGATTTDSTGDYQYTVPFGKVQRRKVGTGRDEVSNIDMSPALDRTPGKVAISNK